MLNLFNQARIFLHRQPADMRLGYEGLRNLASTTFSVNPYGGSLFVGTFAVPKAKALDDKMEIDNLELTLFLEGISVTKISRKKRFSPCEKTGVALH
jgi:hypothetical protein